MIEILTSGLPNLVQDMGRSHYLALGVSRSGALDSYALSMANAALGNDASAAGIEISLFPFKVKFLADMAFCCTGTACPMALDGVPLPPWWARTARAGQTLSIGLPVRGAKAYLAVAGGIDVPEVMGSRSTDMKTGFGGFQGRGLKRGDRLATFAAPGLPDLNVGIAPDSIQALWQKPADDAIVLRVLPGAEYDAFSEAARRALVDTPYRITADANRMGYRLEGQALALQTRLELLSHGIVPGTIQVPPAGQPIIQFAEANTCGGYPKIATIIQADLWRLAQARIGAAVHFSVTQPDEARAALRQQAQELAAIIAQCAAFNTPAKDAS